MSEITQPKSGRLQKNASAGDLIFLTTQDYSNLVSAINGKLNLSGGAMTGYLTLNANPTANLHAAPKQYVDSTSVSAVATHAALTDTVHGSTSVNIGNRIMQRDANGRVSISSPTNPDHAVTLQYFNQNVGDSVAAHANATNVHGATTTANGNRLMMRDANGRVSIGSPSQPDHAARLDNITAALNELYTHINDDTEPHPYAQDFLATPLKLVVRDAAGRSQVANPASGKDIANYQWVVAVVAGYAAINPAAAKNGDILHQGNGTAHMCINGGWRQIYPAIYT